MGKRKAETEAKPVKKPVKSAPQSRTTLCVSSSVISATNTKNLLQISQVAYQLAKAALLFSVGEIVVLDVPTKVQRQELEEKEAAKSVITSVLSKGGKKISFNFDDLDIVDTTSSGARDEQNGDDNIDQEDGTSNSGTGKSSDRNDNFANGMLLATLLQYFITPPYLRKTVFAESPYQKKFQYCNAFPSLSSLPFMGNNNVWKDFREGLTVAKHSPQAAGAKKGKKAPKIKLKTTKYVNVGMSEMVELNKEVPVNVRVTVDLKNKTIVSPQEAYGVVGSRSSFGYMVRVAKNIASVFTECPEPEGYSASVYIQSDDYFSEGSRSGLPQTSSDKITKKGGNVLLVLGNWKELEYMFGLEKLEGIENVGQMFDGELVIPGGARIEDAALVGLSRVCI